jgi:DNA-binding NarL/FixJ family response regulator
MSSATPILAITSDEKLSGLLCSTVRDQLGQTGRIVVTPSVEEACRLLKAARPRLIVFHFTGETGRYEQLDQLLWATSVVTRRTPIVVVADRYRIDQATMMYRMGVSEYVSRKNHLDQLADVLGAYLRPLTLPAADQSSRSNGWAGVSRTSAVSAQVV